MARKIWFKPKEKLAILKIMLDINNHYSTRLSDEALKVIHDTAMSLKLHNGVTEASLMSISEAKDNLKYYSHDYHKREFLFDLLSKMLTTSTYGVYGKLRELEEDVELYDDDDIDDYFSYYSEELEKLGSDIKDEWRYIFELLGDILTVPLDLLRSYYDEKKWIIAESYDETLTNKTKRRECPSESNKVDLVKKDAQKKSQKNPTFYDVYSKPQDKSNIDETKKIGKRIISLNKEEKLAILKIMIDINNHYSERLPNGFGIIQEAAGFLNLHNGVAEACEMATSDAVKIFIKGFGSLPDDKHSFILKSIGYLLVSSGYGVCEKVKKYKYDKTPLVDKFIQEWDYIYKLLNIWDSHRKLYHTLDYLMSVDIPSSEWVIYDNKKENIITKPAETPPAVLPQDSLNAEIPKEVEIKQHSTNSIAPYSDAIKEILYKDL